MDPLFDLDIHVETITPQTTIGRTADETYTTQCNCTSSTSCIEVRSSCPDD